MSSVLSFASSAPTEVPPLLGSSPAMQLARDIVRRVASTSIPVLLVGATGTGKELLARHLHAQSGRTGPLVDVNCGALPREMIESLLFGHRKGAFTGAVESRLGLVRQADHGTLFLDELASLHIEGQVKLLRVLETGEVLPLGEQSKQRVQFRLVATVQEDITARVEAGSFRPDLFHRIAAIEIALPPLARRREDIPVLVEHFAATRGRSVSDAALAMLSARTWPGNVRELRAWVDRAALLVDTSVLGVEAFLDHSTTEIAAFDPRRELLRLCRAHGGKPRAIAEAMGVSRATLFRRLKASGISLGSLRVSRDLETG